MYDLSGPQVLQMVIVLDEIEEGGEVVMGASEGTVEIPPDEGKAILRNMIREGTLRSATGSKTLRIQPIEDDDELLNILVVKVMLYPRDEYWTCQEEAGTQ